MSDKPLDVDEANRPQYDGSSESAKFLIEWIKAHAGWERIPEWNVVVCVLESVHSKEGA